MAKRRSLSSYLPTMRYRSDYPNQVHQLTVTISRHLHLLKTGYYKHQDKPMEISWTKLERGDYDRDHVIHFVIRDHYSGFYYAETHPLSWMITLEGFLHHAWAAKKNYPFVGQPKVLMIQPHILEYFPSLQNFFNHSPGLHTQLATSGFDAGIASVKNWERDFLFNVVHSGVFSRTSIPHRSLADEFILLNANNYSHGYGPDESLLEKYVSGMHLTTKEYQSSTVSTDFQEFSNLFNSKDVKKFTCTFVDKVYHMDLSKETTEQPNYPKLEFRSPRREYLAKVNLKDEIRNRPGFRSLVNQYNSGYYVVYNAEEFGIKNPPYPWVLVCEKHGTRQFHRVVTDALKAGRNRINKFCGTCKGRSR